MSSALLDKMILRRQRIVAAVSLLSTSSLFFLGNFTHKKKLKLTKMYTAQSSHSVKCLGGNPRPTMCTIVWEIGLLTPAWHTLCAHCVHTLLCALFATQLTDIAGTTPTKAGWLGLNHCCIKCSIFSWLIITFIYNFFTQQYLRS